MISSAGRRAAAWFRSLPDAPSPCLGAWLAGEVPEAIEAATAPLDPRDCDRMGPGGVMVHGKGGANEKLHARW